MIILWYPLHGYSSLNPIPLYWLRACSTTRVGTNHFFAKPVVEGKAWAGMHHMNRLQFAMLEEWLTDSSLCHTMLTGYDAMFTSLLFCSNSIPALYLISQLHLCKSQTTSTNGGASSLASGQVASHEPLEASLPAKKHADHLGHFASSQDSASPQNIMKSEIY